MATRLLIGYDGSESADAALDDLRKAGLPREVKALIVSVAEVLMLPPSIEQSPTRPMTPSSGSAAAAQAKAQAAETRSLPRRCRAQRLRASAQSWARRFTCRRNSAAADRLICVPTSTVSV